MCPKGSDYILFTSEDTGTLTQYWEKQNGRKPEEENLASCLKIIQTFMLIPKTLIHETAKLHLGNELLLSYYKNRGLILYTGLQNVLLTSIQDYTKRLS